MEMPNHQKVLDLIDDIKKDIPEGIYIEIMDELKKNREKSMEVFKKEQEYNDKIKNFNENDKTKFLKKQIETLQTKIDCQTEALHNSVEIHNIILMDWDRCPFSNTPLWKAYICIDDDEDNEIKSYTQDNFCRCNSCGVRVLFNGYDGLYRKTIYREKGENLYYCKNCMEHMD